jgi:hypothetical protein
MKYIFYFLILSSLWGGNKTPIFAQNRGFLGLRYEEDYRYLAKDTIGDWYKKLKFSSLNKSKQSFLSQGGEVRYLAQYFKNEEWGDLPVIDYTSFYTRFLYHLDWHWGKNIRFFGQLNSTFANGRVTPNRSIDENRLDLHQAFLDIYFLQNEHTKIVLRAGRQELLYGSQRIIAVREGPNNRQSFDGIKLFYKSNRWQVDFYYAQPLTNKPNLFDDVSNTDRKVWSMYVVGKKIPILGNADVYYIGNYNRLARFNGVAGEETRHSWGTRIWQKTPQWAYDLEALYQFGTFGNQRIRAYTASANLTYSLKLGKISPVLGLKTEIISGDRQKNDLYLNTFNPLFPRGAYFGLAALIGPANLVDFHPSFEINLTKKLVFGIDYDIFWRYSLQDGIYGPNVALIYGDQNSPHAHIGNQLGFMFEYNPNKHLSIVPEITWFKAGEYIKDVSTGKDVLFGALTVQWKY